MSSNTKIEYNQSALINDLEMKMSDLIMKPGVTISTSDIVVLTETQRKSITGMNGNKQNSRSDHVTYGIDDKLNNLDCKKTNSTYSKSKITDDRSGIKPKRHVTFNKNKFVEIINVENWSHYNRLNVHIENFGDVDDYKCRCNIL